MKNRIFTIIFSFFLFFLGTSFTLAQEVQTPGGGASEQLGSTTKLSNPLEGGNIEDIPSFVQQLLEIALQVGVPLIALAIIYTGYLFIAAQGAPDKLTQAKQSLVYVVIGAAILLGAYVLAEAIMGTINAIRGV